MREHALTLTFPERRELKKRLRSRTLPAEDVRRARLILMLAQGESYSQIQQMLACNRSYISCWKQRFVEQRLAGLYARHQGRAVAKTTPKLEARILAWTRKAPPDGSTHWSTRKLAQQLGINHMMVARVWKRASLDPIVWTAIWLPMIPSSKPKPLILLVSMFTPRSMPPCFVSTRNRPFKLWIAWIPSCRYHPAVLNATALSTTDMAPYRSMLP